MSRTAPEAAAPLLSKGAPPADRPGRAAALAGRSGLTPATRTDWRSRFLGAGSRLLAALLLGSAALGAHADAVDTLREFVRDVKSGRAGFTQTVTSSDGTRKKSSSGSFEFMRPNRFRFNYAKPFEQVIVADGQKVWIYDADLNQASSRKLEKALGATPAALLAGGSLEQDFKLSAQPAQDGLEWALATPKAEDSAFKSMRVGFRGKDLAAVEILDNFGQRSLLQFGGFSANPVLAPETFRFVPPAGADVIEQ